MEENNRVVVIGTVVEECGVNHEIYGEKFYKFFIRTDRKSSVADIIPVFVSEKLLDPIPYMGSTVQIMGEYRSRNTENRTLDLNVFANSFELVSNECEHINEVYMEGYICKPTVFRSTPLGRRIGEILLAVNRRYNKSDYIPCITWGRNACFASKLDVGAKIAIEGRIQSREYKKVVDGAEINKITYEISVSWLQVLAENKGE